ncbi:major histocompatibility complex class I-related protein [Labeo rohita]|uniref:Major histocompatibility complex class I-related protein n=1 Tax=Labeo rohita TaxID=84645 RepID=A0A498MB85_LABRO|nr:major histocompatibility complex class I-related protein [Labeo rohita]
MLDDLQVMYYDSITWQVVHRSYNVSTLYHEEKSDAGVIFRDMYNDMRIRAFYLKEHLNQTDGVHVHQRLAGCELLNDDKPGPLQTWDAFDQQRKEEFIFNKEKNHFQIELPWIMWDNLQFIHMKFLYKNVYYPVCIKALQGYLQVKKNNVMRKGIHDQQRLAGCDLLNNGKPGLFHFWDALNGQNMEEFTSDMEKKKRYPDENVMDVKPRVRLMRKMLPDSQELQISCLATGFYPRHINLTLFRDGRPVDDDQITGGEILPSGDGTYQMRKSLVISEEELLKPRVRLMRKTLPDSEGIQISCLATGFYPRHINLTLFRDDQPVDDDQITGGEILPNGDGTYQMRKSLVISEEELREGHKYNCTMKHLNLDNKLDITFDVSEYEPGSFSLSVVVSVLVFMCVAVLIITALIIWRKKHAAGQGSETTKSDYSLTSCSHSLMAFATYIDGQTPFPEFSVVLMLDDVQIVYYDSTTWKVVYRTCGESKYYDEEQSDAGVVFQDGQPVDDDHITGGEILPNGDGTYQMRKSLVISEEELREGHKYNCTMKHLNLDNKLNITFGVHVIQRVVGCELLSNDKPGLLKCWDAFDGQSSGDLTFDMRKNEIQNTMQWEIAWNQGKLLHAQYVLQNVYHPICIKTLRRYLNMEKNNVKRKVKPRVRLMRKMLPDSQGLQISCLATGFYPRHINLTLFRDDQPVDDDQITGEILPNGDGTYQMRKILVISEEELHEGHKYNCTMKHLSLDNKLNITFDVAESDSGSSTQSVVVSVLVFMCVAVLIITTLIIWRKRRAAGRGSETSQSNNTPTPCVHVTQRVVGCELLSNDKPGLLKSWDAVDGQNIGALTFDTEKKEIQNTMQWEIAWDQGKLLHAQYILQNVYHPICIKTLRRYLNMEKNNVKRKVKPRVRLMRKMLPDSQGLQISCLATGFYPRHINLTLFRDGQPVDDDQITGGEILPNGDGTYQMRKTLVISEEELREEYKYNCTMKHLSLDNKLDITFDVAESDSGSSTQSVVFSVLVLMCVAVLIITTLIICRKRRAAGRGSETSQSNYSLTPFEHDDLLYAACSDVEEEFYIGYDEEELGHVDFKQKRAVETLPDFVGPNNISFPRFYEIGADAIVGCKRDLPIFIQTFKSLPLEMDLDAPQTSIYPKDDVELGVQNTLICHVTGFYPPSVNISWTKNNVIVTEGISISQYRPRTDDTFNIFSTLKFTPDEGDIYSCTVSHKALQGQPQTKIWDVNVALPSVGPAVFCGVGLSLGLMGVILGTFFLMKGHNCH